MARLAYNPEKEHEVIGTYPGLKGMELNSMNGGYTFIPESPQYWRPIDPKDNYKMLLREGKTPYWIPTDGWFLCDVNGFRPRQHPENLANHQCLDGGDAPDWKSLGLVQKGWFNLDLEWEPAAMGATVRPGSPVMPTMDNWEELAWPNLDEIDWEAMRALNTTYLGTNKANKLGIQFTLWERLMCLMDVDNAAVALLDEDQEEDLHAFLDRFSDLMVDYISRIRQIGRIDAVMMHDDWGTQNSPFFSLACAKEIFVPPFKKIVDYCHANGIVVEHHCCGNASALVPAMLETGSDYWVPQEGINDVDALIETYKDADFTFGVYSPTLSNCETPDQVRAEAEKWVEKYHDKGVLLVKSPLANMELYPIFVDAVYELSRKAYQDSADEPTID